MSSSLLMTWQRVPQQKRKCKKGVDQVSDSCDSYDLTISIKKTEVVYQPAPGKPYKEPTITVKGQRLQVVDKFTYLGSTLSRVVHIDDEVNASIAKASAAFSRLRGSIWDRSGIRRHKAESIQIAGTANTIICMRNLASDSMTVSSEYFNQWVWA